MPRILLGRRNVIHVRWLKNFHVGFYKTSSLYSFRATNKLLNLLDVPERLQTPYGHLWINLTHIPLSKKRLQNSYRGISPRRIRRLTGLPRMPFWIKFDFVLRSGAMVLISEYAWTSAEAAADETPSAVTRWLFFWHGKYIFRSPKAVEPWSSRRRLIFPEEHSGHSPSIENHMKNRRHSFTACLSLYQLETQAGIWY